MEQAIKSCTNINIFNQLEGAKVVEAADIILTTHELEAYNTRQLFLPMLPTDCYGYDKVNKKYYKNRL